MHTFTSMFCFSQKRKNNIILIINSINVANIH